MYPNLVGHCTHFRWIDKEQAFIIGFKLKTICLSSTNKLHQIQMIWRAQVKVLRFIHVFCLLARSHSFYASICQIGFNCLINKMKMRHKIEYKFINVLLCKCERNSTNTTQPIRNKTVVNEWNAVTKLMLTSIKYMHCMCESKRFRVNKSPVQLFYY